MRAFILPVFATLAVAGPLIVLMRLQEGGEPPYPVLWMTAAGVAGLVGLGAWGPLRDNRNAAYWGSLLIRLPANGVVALLLRWVSRYSIPRHAGIRVHDVDHDEHSAEFLGLVAQALALIERHDPRRYRAVVREIRHIARTQSHRANATYMRGGRLCGINLARLLEHPAERRLPMLAEWIVHEATHGVIWSRGIGYTARTQDRIEWICTMEAWRFLGRLPREEHPCVDQLRDELARFDPSWWPHARVGR